MAISILEKAVTPKDRHWRRFPMPTFTFEKCAKFIERHWKRPGRAGTGGSMKHDGPSLASNEISAATAAVHSEPQQTVQSSLEQHALQDASSLPLEQQDIPSTTDFARLANPSAPQIETEDLHPSRSTSGSDSVNPDDDRRSLVSCPPGALPWIHDEPSQLNSPPIPSHRPSDSSTKNTYYRHQEDREKVIPKDILCYLKVVFDGRKLGKKMHFNKFDWQDDASYGVLDNAAEKCLQSAPETINKKTWRTDGVCKLFKNDQQFSSKALETRDQWYEALDLIIAEFVTSAGNYYTKFHLEITWTYAAMDESVNETEYSKKIANRIHDRMKRNWRKKHFIPQKDLHAIMSETVIDHLIRKDNSLQEFQGRASRDESPCLPPFNQKKFICDVKVSRKRLLALCIYVDLPLIYLWQMLYLKEKPANLPLELSDRPPLADIRVFETLLIKQWYFMAYEFPKPTDAAVHCFTLRDDEILPIEACSEAKPIGEGAYKEVYEVQIQPGHHRFTADKTSIFALKEFKNGSSFQDFDRESKVLRKLLDDPHPHISPHYASWSQMGHFFMLSPLAKCNLREYWRDNLPRLNDAGFVLWYLRQLQGLADGLRRIYNLGGWHHDLKAENILVFDEGDPAGPTLKIADFGSAKIRPRRSGPRDKSSPTRNYTQGTSAYEAPDFVICGETSRPYDVWTLGCIFFEMLVWTFASNPLELDTFSQQRRRLPGDNVCSHTMFWYVQLTKGYCTTHWKPEVEKRFKELEERCDSLKGRAVFKELVLTTRKMLRMDPDKRPKIYEIYNDMERMTLWAKDAVKESDWNIQSLLIGATPSTAKSETSGDADVDSAPARAPHGHIMMDIQPWQFTKPSTLRSGGRRPLGERSDFQHMGSQESLEHFPTGSSVPQLIVDEVDPVRTQKTTMLDKAVARPLIGSHTISLDHVPFDEAQTVVPSASASEFQ